MRTSQVVASAVVAVAVFWTVGAYNRLVRLRNAIARAFVQTDVPLRQRHALIAQLTALVEPHMGDTRDALEALNAARQQALAAADLVRLRPVAAGAITSLAMAEQVLSAATARLMSAIEASPTLAATPGLAELTANMSGIDNQLGYAREMFNNSVLAYNSAVRQFPTRLLAQLFGLRAAATL